MLDGSVKRVNVGTSGSRLLDRHPPKFRRVSEISEFRVTDFRRTPRDIARASHRRNKTHFDETIFGMQGNRPETFAAYSLINAL
jgi:hypothetical protein